MVSSNSRLSKAARKTPGGKFRQQKRWAKTYHSSRFCPAGSHLYVRGPHLYDKPVSARPGPTRPPQSPARRATSARRARRTAELPASACAGRAVARPYGHGAYAAGGGIANAQVGVVSQRGRLQCPRFGRWRERRAPWVRKAAASREDGVLQPAAASSRSAVRRTAELPKRRTRTRACVRRRWW